MTERRFARFRRAPLDAFPDASEVPDNGMCLSVFLVLEPKGRPGEVLMGRVDRSAPWWEIGGVGERRLDRIADRWMLPSRQLLLFEAPDDAAQAILRDQLGVGPLPLAGPRVFSDPADGPGTAGRDPHWDLHFVYRGTWPEPDPPRAAAWRQIEFRDIARTPRDEIARGQGDVLALVGLRPLG